MSPGLTARQAGLLSCHVCGQLSRPPANANTLRCPRCNAPLHLRKPASLATTWALVLAAAILFVPANLLPIMTTTSLLGTQQDTIMSGIVYLWTSGSWHLAIIVFIASFFVPLAKLGILAVLCLSVQQRWRWNPRLRTRLYVIVEAIGPILSAPLSVVSYLPIRRLQAPTPAKRFSSARNIT